MKIAIDGPAGAGKSSIAKALAQRLDIQYLDTGAMYRAIAYKAIQEKIALDDVYSMATMMGKTQIEITFSGDGEQKVLVDGTDVTAHIRDQSISAAASEVAAYQQVRSALVAYQKKLAMKHDVVMDGRDIGTVVLPDADYKFFITAAPEIRARRRLMQLESQGLAENSSLESILTQIKERDEKDMTRDFMPLVQAEDAVCIDTSECTLDESIEKILSIIKK